ncbi:hypothetical protein BVRB_034430 [Beta vulgaris subsp. vulgaris]|uniref:Profilin n=1 Tax=Beta vulgaris subsp. vulgaris TaxID=3555 RepID=A0A0J7YPZ9_BETVV|nr:hypothetical protein BVRB_034430 [Beta vulgaris subsp. vulgaris]
MATNEEQASTKTGWAAWNDLVMRTKDIAASGIYTFDGAVCDQINLAVTPAETKAIYSGMSGSATPALSIGGTKYMLLRSDPDSLQARNANVPISVFKTKTLLVVGVGKPGSSAEVLSVGVSKVAEMLVGQNL